MLSVLWRFRSVLRPYRGPLLLGGLLVLVVSSLELSLPWPLKVVVDNVLAHKQPTGRLAQLVGPLRSSTYGLLAVCSLSLVLLAALVALGTYLSSLLLQGVGERIIADLRLAIFAHPQRLSLSFHDSQRVGDLANRLTGDVNAVQGLLVAGFGALVPNVALLIGILLVALIVQPAFALVVLVIAPLLYAVVRHYRTAIKQASREARKHEGHVASHVNETLSAIRLVQSFAAERRGLDRFRGHSDARLRAGLRQVDLQARLPAAIDIVGQFGRAAVLFLGAALVLRGQLSLGLLLVLLTYLQQLYGPMRALARLSSTIAKGQASAERIDDILASQAVVAERANAVDAPALTGRVELERVWFGYAPDQPVLRDVSLLALPGQVIALAGTTGAGKSTITGLIARLYDVTAGRVLLDGNDVRGLTLRSVRSQVAVVQQDPLLVSGTILDNIMFGAPHASREELLAAAEAAYVDEFALRLPDGYDTVVSERGTSLSGGQRQRIAIARALAADTPIVVLDEATSGLDAVSEDLVMQGLARLTAGRTVLVVAHRLSTLRDADRIYVLERGQVIDAGRHDELAARTGTYREMSKLLSAT